MGTAVPSEVIARQSDVAVTGDTVEVVLGTEFSLFQVRPGFDSVNIPTSKDNTELPEVVIGEVRSAGISG